MKLNPVLSVFLGLIAIIVGIIVIEIIFGSGITSIISITGAVLFTIIILIILAGGFLATYLTKEKKIRYGASVGIIAALFLISGMARHLVSYDGIALAVLILVFFTVITSLGGFIAKMTNSDYRQSTISKHMKNGFSPELAIIIGIIVTLICSGLLNLVTGVFSSFTTSFGITNYVIGAFSLAIGGLVTTFSLREKKLQYGVYEGVIVIIIILLIQLRQGTLHENYYVLIGTTAFYLLAAAIGSYLGKLVDKRLKREQLKS